MNMFVMLLGKEWLQSFEFLIICPCQLFVDLILIFTSFSLVLLEYSSGLSAQSMPSRPGVIRYSPQFMEMRHLICMR